MNASEWLHVEYRGLQNLSKTLKRQWFTCTLPDDDLSSEDDTWLHVADIFMSSNDNCVSSIDINISEYACDHLKAEIDNNSFLCTILCLIKIEYQHSFPDSIIVHTIIPESIIRFTYDSVSNMIFEWP